MKNVCDKILSKAVRSAEDVLLTLEIPLCKSDKKIKSFKNLHKGCRGFIIGNGPSLKVEDLDKLKGEISFGSNKIFLAFTSTAWRPTYYSVCDHLVAVNNAEAISGLPLTKILSNQIKQFLPQVTDAIWFRERFENWVWTNQGLETPCDRTGKFSKNFFFGSHAGWTILYHQLQLAFYMGIREVGLLGVDFSFNTPTTKVETALPDYKLALRAEGEQNHFHPDYRKPGELWGIPDLAMQKIAFALARKEYEAAGGRIVNCSRTTKLDVFDRITLDAIL